MSSRKLLLLFDHRGSAVGVFFMDGNWEAADVVWELWDEIWG